MLLLRATRRQRLLLISVIFLQLFFLLSLLLTSVLFVRRRVLSASCWVPLCASPGQPCRASSLRLIPLISVAALALLQISTRVSWLVSLLRLSMVKLAFHLASSPLRSVVMARVNLPGLFLNGSIVKLILDSSFARTALVVVVIFFCLLVAVLTCQSRCTLRLRLETHRLLPLALR